MISFKNTWMRNIKMKQNNWTSWSKEDVVRFQTLFLEWYHHNQRNLPWRADTDPYHVWISEIMLQQTRVDTVIDYYYRFMERFPTIESLANAQEEELLKAWEGLGYYSRARNLKVAAMQIMEDFSGKFPQTITEISSLKGIGPYTTGAIGSISFKLPEPAIDGNLMRVSSRLFGIDADIAKASNRKIFDEALRSVLSKEEPGDMNQAFMDLGSGVCKPVAPECEICPLKKFCYAYHTNRQEDFPVKTKKPRPKDVYFIAGVIENQHGEYLLTQRSENGLLAKMWHYPLEEVTKEQYQLYKQQWEKEAEPTLFSVAEEAAPNFFDDSIVWQTRHLGEVKHVFSHLRWHLLLFYGRAMHSISVKNGQWEPYGRFSTYVFPKVQQKMVDQWKKNNKNGKHF